MVSHGEKPTQPTYMHDPHFQCPYTSERDAVSPRIRRGPYFATCFLAGADDECAGLIWATIFGPAAAACTPAACRRAPSAQVRMTHRSFCTQLLYSIIQHVTPGTTVINKYFISKKPIDLPWWVSIFHSLPANTSPAGQKTPFPTRTDCIGTSALLTPE